MKATHITTKTFAALLKEGVFCIIVKHISNDKVLVKMQTGHYFHGNLSGLREIPEIEPDEVQSTWSNPNHYHV